MFILGSLGPLHYSSGDGFTVRIDELPVMGKLRRRHPLGQRFGRVLLDVPARLN